jgi:hypothetical protein
MKNGLSVMKDHKNIAPVADLLNGILLACVYCMYLSTKLDAQLAMTLAIMNNIEIELEYVVDQLTYRWSCTWSCSRFCSWRLVCSGSGAK